MGSLRYAVHAYAWTTRWSNDTLHLIDHTRSLGFDLIEIPLMDVELVDPTAIRSRLDAVGLDVCTSTACPEDADPTADEESVRRRGVDYLKACVRATAAMGARTFSGVLYSAIGRRLPGMPDERHRERAAAALKEVARFAQDVGVGLGLEPVNRYETFLVNTCDQALDLIARIDEPNVGVHLDAYHMNIEEEDFYSPTLQAAPLLCHYHLSESHRGTPGTGVVDWDGIFRALAESGYQGVVGLESFTEVSDSMRAATCIWRPLAPSSDHLLSRGLAFLRALENRAYGHAP